MKKLSLAAVLLTVLFYGCGNKTLPEGAAAVVNKTVISEEEFNKTFDLFKDQYAAQGITLSEGDLEMARPQMLESMIIKALLTEKADELKIEADEEAVAGQLAQFKGSYGSDEAFAAALETNGYTEEKLLDEMREQSRLQALFQKVVYDEIAIGEEALKAYYEGNPQMFVIPETVEASHILVLVNEERDEAAALKEIQRIKAKIDGGMDFGAAAQEFSEGPTSSVQGSLGRFGRGQMDPAFEKAAFEQEAGVVGEPVLSRFGYHLILTTLKNPEETMDFEASKGFIEQQLSQEQYKEKSAAYIETIREEADVILPEWAQPKEEEEAADLQTTG